MMWVKDLNDRSGENLCEKFVERVARQTYEESAKEVKLVWLELDPELLRQEGSWIGIRS
jgi:hypothetical protein